MLPRKAGGPRKGASGLAGAVLGLVVQGRSIRSQHGQGTVVVVTNVSEKGGGGSEAAGWQWGGGGVGGGTQTREDAR